MEKKLTVVGKVGTGRFMKRKLYNYPKTWEQIDLILRGLIQMYLKKRPLMNRDKMRKYIGI